MAKKKTKKPKSRIDPKRKSRAWKTLTEIEDYFDRVKDERLNETGRLAVDQARDLALRLFRCDDERKAASLAKGIDNLLNTARKCDDAASAQDMRRLKDFQEEKKAQGDSLRLIR